MNDQLMIEYIFFHPVPYRKFLEFLSDRDVHPMKEERDQTDVEALVVYLQDNLDDELSDQIEACYDDLMTLNEHLVAEQEQADEFHQVGVAVTLASGRSVLASVEPDVLNKVLTVISHQQLGELVDAIVEAVENPDERPLCKRR